VIEEYQPHRFFNLSVAIVVLFAFIVGFGVWWEGKAHPAEDRLVASYLNGKIQVFYLEHLNNECYVTVGKLHGYTVDTECKFDEVDSPNTKE
jgi:hypothetical protein